MTNSIFLAKLMGPVMLAVGIGVFVNGQVYRALADEFLRSRALIYLSGLLTMTAGMALILTHNVWVARWPVLITVLGWAMAIGGAFRIVAPQGTEKLGRAVIKSKIGLTLAGAIWVAAGAALSFFGYR
ncbi:MAG: hypothetical protein ACRECO_15265 [Xanthobacteraceae bacterium]